MKKVIGKVQEIDGDFFAKTSDGEVI